LSRRALMARKPPLDMLSLNTRMCYLLPKRISYLMPNCIAITFPSETSMQFPAGTVITPPGGQPFVLSDQASLEFSPGTGIIIPSGQTISVTFPETGGFDLSPSNGGGKPNQRIADVSRCDGRSQPV